MNDQTENFGPLGQTSTSGFAREAERAGQRVGAQVGRLAETAGTKFDSAVDYMGETAQSVKQSFQAMTDEGWDGMKRKAVDYTRKEPLNALLLAIGTGILGGLGDAESEVDTMFKDTAPPMPFSRLPELLERLYDSLASFLDAKLALFRKEVWEEGQSLIRRGMGVAAAGVVAFVGFMVLTAALILSLDTRIGNLSLSCLIVGAGYFVGGAGTAVVLAKNVDRAALHKTRIELEKDKQWIKQTSDI